jgi:hypothetical protein
MDRLGYKTVHIPIQGQQVFTWDDIVEKTGIQPVLAYYTPIPHTPMWEKAKKFSRFNLEENPVFTNNTLFPCLGKNNETKLISQLKKLAG